MSYATCLVPPEALRGETLTLTGERYLHLFRARRFGIGAELRLVDGLGAARWGRVEQVGSKEALVRLAAEAELNEAGLHLELWVAPLRPQRAAWLVEKATEVGVGAIRWLDTERAGREVTPPRLDRLRRVAEAAVEQCHRARVPEISGLHAWSEAIASLAGPGASWFLDTASGVGFDVAGEREVGSLLVGPEGGWSDAERAELSTIGASAVGLGPRQLRAETAAIAGATLLLCRSRV